MAIGLASAIGLGGKRESIISDLGKGISDIGEGIEKGRLAQAKQQAQMDAIAADSAAKISVPKGNYTDKDATDLQQKAIQLRSELMLKAKQGASESSIKSLSSEYSDEMSHLAKKAGDFYTFINDASAIKNQGQFDTTDVDTKVAEWYNTDIGKRPSGEVYKSTLELALPKTASFEVGVKKTDPNFDFTNYFQNTKIEGTDKVVFNTQQFEKDKPMLIMKAIADPTYAKNVDLRVKQIAPVYLNNIPSSERTPDKLDALKEYIIQDDINTSLKQAELKRTKDMAINLPSQGKGLNINFGGGGVTIDKQTTFVDQPKQPIDKEAQDNLRKLQKEYDNEVRYIANLKAKSEKLTDLERKERQRFIDRAEIRKSNLLSKINKSEKENVENYRNSYTLLNVMTKSGAERGKTFFDEKGGKIEGISRVDNIVFDPQTGAPVALIGMQKEGDVENSITIPVNSTNVGILNNIMENTLLIHAKEHQKQNHLRPESVSALDNLLVKSQNLSGGGKEATKQAAPNKEAVKKETTVAKTYTIKGKQYTLAELTKMGYTEQQVEPYKNK